MKRSILAAVFALMTAVGAGAHAKAPQAPPAVTVPVPIGSPGDWLSPSDYPVAALRYDMEGISTFVLTVDAQGKPTDCHITISSKFDVLDEAACERLMRNGRFVPALPGQPAVRRWYNRVRWVMPSAVTPFREFARSIQFELDPAGKRTSCRLTEGAVEGEDDPCRLSADMGSDFGLVLRGGSAAPTVEVLVETAGALGSGPPAMRTGPVVGYDLRGLHVFSFEIASTGKMSKCKLIEQRGPGKLINDFCSASDHWTYEVPFAQMAADGSVKGWAVTRILVRTGK